MARPRPGRRPTLQDIADRAGVSRAMASIVVREAPGASPATRARVLAVAEELGYQPDVHARLLARQHTRLIGVTAQLGHPFHADVVDQLYAAAERRGYDLALSATSPGRTAERAVRSLLGYRAEALVLVAPDIGAAELSGISRRMPVAVLAHRARDDRVHVVRTADDLGIRQAVEHLVLLGHTRIAHLDGGRLQSAADRRRGYRTAMRQHDLAEQLIEGGQSEEDGARGARTLLASDLPTAVVCFNDRTAVGLLDVLIRAGVAVPDEISVVGFDDSQLARLSHINLTTVAQDVSVMADLAVSALVRELDQNGAPDDATPVPGAETAAAGMWRGHEAVLPPRLVVRGSTGPARNDPSGR